MTITIEPEEGRGKGYGVGVGLEGLTGLLIITPLPLSGLTRHDEYLENDVMARQEKAGWGTSERF